MVSGMEKYFQIVRCFRDEDLRADRQPEFTQIDIEMSFVRPDDVFRLIEGMMVRLCKEVKGIDIPTPFPRMPYSQAMARFGNDKPDIRFDLEIRELSALFSQTDIKVFRQIVAEGGGVGAWSGGVSDDPFSRKELDDLIPLAQDFGAKGLAWIRVTEDGWQSPLAKFVSDDRKQEIEAALGLKPKDLLLMVADQEQVGLRGAVTPAPLSGRQNSG